jgi:hypothetical protein
MGDENYSLQRYKSSTSAAQCFLGKRSFHAASGCKTLANAPPTLKTTFFVPSSALTIAGWTSSRPLLVPQKFPRPKRQQETLLVQLVGHRPAEQNN